MWLRLSALLMITYPLMAPLFLWLGEPMLLVFLLATITLLLALDRLQKKDHKAATISLLTLVLFIALLLFNSAEVLIFIPPVMIPLGLFLLFHQSLAKSSTPLITKYAEIIDGELNEELRSYTRVLTKVWRGLFLLLAVESLILALFVSIDVWAWFTHIFNYIFIFSVFIAEYIYRKKRFGSTSTSFWNFLKKIVNLRPKDVLERK